MGNPLPYCVATIPNGLGIGVVTVEPIKVAKKSTSGLLMRDTFTLPMPKALNATGRIA